MINFIKCLKTIIQKNTKFNIKINQPSQQQVSKEIETNQISLLEKLQSTTNITSLYKDKMTIERRNILESYANKTLNNGTMYYIYHKSENYLASICEKGRSHEYIEIPENLLPKGAGVDSVLRLKNNSYILDNKATEIVQDQMQKKFSELLNLQEVEMHNNRIEGHLYEFVEFSNNSAYLVDTTKDNGKIFQEFNFPEELLCIAKEGELYVYKNGKYMKA